MIPQGASRHSREHSARGLYETPPIAIEALIRCENLPHWIWEPACGRGAIVRVLEAHGHECVASDLKDYGCNAARVDFLMELRAPKQCTAIVTNPPFALAEKFIRHGLDLCPRVFMLLRLAFLEGRRPTGVMEHLARVHVFTKRLPMMHRDGWEGPRSTSSVCHAWFCFDAAHSVTRTPTQLFRVI